MKIRSGLHGARRTAKFNSVSVLRRDVEIVKEMGHMEWLWIGLEVFEGEREELVTKRRKLNAATESIPWVKSQRFISFYFIILASRCVLRKFCVLKRVLKS